MGKYKFIYCKKCDEFYLNWSHDFGDDKDACPNIRCLNKNILIFYADSFAEMAQIERQYKINKIKNE